MCCEVRPPRSVNPYFNRWLCLDGHAVLREARCVALLDWDVLYMPGAPLPGAVEGRVMGRRNPSTMYRDLVAGQGWLPAALQDYEGGLASSVNGGVLIAGGPELVRVARESDAWLSRLDGDLAMWEPWQVEQMVISIAVGAVGFAPLDDAWNVTP